MPKLIVFRGRTKEAVHELDPAEECSIGRTETATIRIDSPMVSRRHARVWWDAGRDEGCWILSDLGGTNGVWVNGEQVQEKVLSLGDFLEFGRHVIVFHESGLSRLEDLPTYAGRQSRLDEEESTVQLTADEMKRMVNKAETRLATHVRWKAETGLIELRLTEPRYLIGFTAQCAIRLPGNPLLGKTAAKLGRDFAGKWVLEPLSSLTAVRVNGEKVAGSRELGDGDTISVKGQELTFHSAMVE